MLTKNFAYVLSAPARYMLFHVQVAVLKGGLTGAVGSAWLELTGVKPGRLQLPLHLRSLEREQGPSMQCKRLSVLRAR